MMWMSCIRAFMLEANQTSTMIEERDRWKQDITTTFFYFVHNGNGISFVHIKGKEWY